MRGCNLRSLPNIFQLHNAFQYNKNTMDDYVLFMVWKRAELVSLHIKSTGCRLLENIWIRLFN